MQRKATYPGRSRKVRVRKTPSLVSQSDAMSRFVRLACLGVVVLVEPRTGIAQRSTGTCIEVAVDFTPADALQLVAWIERADGSYVDTIYITEKTGRFGLGNRPGRSDFNTGSRTGDTWPYGRRTQTFPVWAARHGRTFPLVVFQNGDESNLSHPFAQSSPESPPPYCRPIQPSESTFDTGTCASAAYTDKGTFSTTETSRYPPRSDIARNAEVDSPSVEQYRAMNVFDAVSRATPPGGTAATITWAVPTSVDYGNYVLFVEAAKTYDFNASYNPMTFPAPTGIPWSNYGMPWRGQPSIVYQVPFVIAETDTRAATLAYAGYGDPNGDSGILNPPDTTITTDTPGSGASRLQLVADGGEMYRVRVRTTSELDTLPPANVGAANVSEVGSTTATIQFVAPGDDGMAGKASGYEIRLRAGSPLVADNFASSLPVSTTLVPDAAGQGQRLDLADLLPETEYWLGIRALDNCGNTGELTVVTFTTADREVAAVDWCFVATAAYGSALANEVVALRSFRDSWLATSVLGELAIETYYTFGPAAAGAIAESELLRHSARNVLEQIVSWIRPAVHTGHRQSSRK